VEGGSGGLLAEVVAIVRESEIWRECKREGGGERGSKIFGDFRRRHAKNFSFSGQRWVDENYMVFSAAIGWPAKIIW
jgi:hypothetical protein